MKASLQFRDDEKPLLRAKVPISILGLPFFSGVAAADTKDLRFDLTTAFDSGPSVRVSYRPNDSWNPFGLVFKTGVGSFGSPVSSPMSMSAEFSLLGRGGPSFLLHFKPRIGDFCIKKTTSSSSSSSSSPLGGIVVGNNGESVDDSVESRMYSFGKMMSSGFPMEEIIPSSSSKIEGLMSGVEVTAKSVLPLKGNAAVKFRWGVKIPPEIFQLAAFGRDGGRSGKHHPASCVSSRSLPTLVMSKISIQHVPAVRSKKEEEEDGADGLEPVDAAKAWFSLGKQLEEMKAENGMLRTTVEDLRSEFCRSAVVGVPAGAVGSDGKAKDVNEEMKSAVVGWKNGLRAGGGSSPTKEDVNEEGRDRLLPSDVRV